MTARLIVFWIAIAVITWALAFVFNGIFFGTWSLTWQQGLIGVLVGFFAGAFLDLFLGSVGEAEA